MPSAKKISARQHIAELLPLWIFILLFKSSAVLHYSLIGVLGVQVLPLWAVGLATGSTTLFQLICDIPAGRLIDRYGARATLRLASIFFLAGVITLFFGVSPLTYGLTLLFSATGWLFFTPSISAYILSVTPDKIMGKTTGVRRMAEGLGGMIATFGLASVLNFSLITIALILSYPLIGASVILWFIWKPKRIVKRLSRHHQRAQAVLSGPEALKRALAAMSPAAPLLLGWSLAIGFSYGIIWLVIPLSIAGGLMNIPGYSLGIFETSMLLSGLTLGSLVDSVRDRGRLIILAMMLCLLSLSVMTSGSAGLFILFAFLFGASDELVTISLWAWLDALDQKHDQDGIVSGAITLADDLGWTLGPIAGAILLANFGPNLAIFAAGGPTLALLIIFLHYRLKRQK